MLDTRTRLLARVSVLDSAEKYIMVTFYIFFAYRMIQGFATSGSLVTLIYLIDQLVVLIFILARRPPKELSVRIDDWILGFAGTLLALLISPPSGAPLAPPLVLNGLLFAGFAIHLSAKLALRRSFGVVAANRGIKATGVYRVVRHPMYLGYCVSQLGILLAGPTLANALIVASCWALFLMRINAEERLLLRDEVYRGFAERTRYRILPGVY